jgi:hypothetical protein
LTTRKTQNSIIALATLGVYLGLLLAGATSQLLAQTKSSREIAINKKPLVDFADDVAGKSKTEEVDLKEPFSIEYEVFFNNKGGLDLKKSRIVRSDGNPKLVEVAKRGIEAIGDSGYFQYLQNLSVNILSNLQTKEKARSITSMLKLMIEVAKTQTKNEDDRMLLKHMNVTSSESAFIISLVIPSAQVREMTLSKLAKSSNE